jgi:SAM-dependent methyltransferase
VINAQNNTKNNNTLVSTMMLSNRSSASININTPTWVALAFLGGTAVGYSCSYSYSFFRLIKKNDQKENSILSSGAESHLWKIVEYSMTGALIRAGDKLDIYNKLHQWGPLSAADLAAKAGWSERWTREFLLQATAAGICEYTYSDDDDDDDDDGDGELFQIRADYAKFLRGPSEERRSIAGMFQFLSALVRRSDAVVEGVRTGVGVDYDFGDEDICSAIDRKNGNFFRFHLIDDVIKTVTVPHTGERLFDLMERGIYVADVGCGCGTSTITMAMRFPNSHFYAYESSPRSIRLLEETILREKITNITVCNVADRTVGDGPNLNDPNSKFAFVYAHDVLHDMTNPRALIQDVKKRLSKDGCWLVVDIDCCENTKDNLAKPNAATLYAFSCLLCLSMATSESGGEGLGTCGFSPALAQRWMKKAGFQYFEQRTLKALPYNACYLVA